MTASRAAEFILPVQPDLPTLAAFLSKPFIAVQVALSVQLGRKWPWPSKVRTNFAAVRTGEGTLLFHYGPAPDTLLDGIWDDNPHEGYTTIGMLALLTADDGGVEREALSAWYPLQAPAPLEMVDLGHLFPEAGRIYVPDATACEITYTQTIRDEAFRFDVSGIRIYSSEASTLIERGTGGVLECLVQS